MLITNFIFYDVRFKVPSFAKIGFVVYMRATSLWKWALTDVSLHLCQSSREESLSCGPLRFLRSPFSFSSAWFEDHRSKGCCICRVSRTHWGKLRFAKLSDKNTVWLVKWCHKGNTVVRLLAPPSEQSTSNLMRTQTKPFSLFTLQIFYFLTFWLCDKP